MMAESKDSEFRPLPDAEEMYRRWLAHLDGEFKRQESPDRRAEIVRDELYEMYLGRPRGGAKGTSLLSETAIFVMGDSLDPRNASLEGDYASGVDKDQYAIRRPLIWFWQMFDRSPLGLNLWLGFRFRCMLGHHVFRKLGKGVKIYPEVRFTLGYNISIEDGCTLGRGSVLDDRGGDLVLPQGTDLAAGTTFSPQRDGHDS